MVKNLKGHMSRKRNVIYPNPGRIKMDWTMKKVWPIATLALLSVATLVGAAEDKKKPSAGMATGVTAPSARPALENNKGWILDVEALFWRSNPDGLYPTIESDNTGLNQTPDASRFTNAHFNYLSPRWDVGFRLGAGYNMVHDAWDVYADWTHFHNHLRKDTEADSETFPSQTLTALWSAWDQNQTPNTINQAISASVAQSRYKLNLNLVDLELGRKLYVGQWLAIRPNIGLRGALIKQDFRMEYFQGVGTTVFNQLVEVIHMKNDFRGLGLRGGMNTQWNMGGGWSFFGDGAFSIIYGAFDVDQHEQNGPIATTNPSNVILDVENNFHASRAIADLQVGIRWEHLFAESKNTVSVSLGWEQHIFWNQMEWMRFNTLVNGPNTVQSVLPATTFSHDGGDLSTQGVTLGVRFDF
jgi:hypothetical protein